MVKGKSGIFHIFTVAERPYWRFALPLLALLTFISSWGGAFPAHLIEQVYARRLFPVISSVAGRFADAVSFAWLDPTVVIAVILLLFCVGKRRWVWLWNSVAFLYLLFFWFWGIN